MSILLLPIIVSFFTIIYTFFLIKKIDKAHSGSGKIIEVSLAIREGAIAYLKREYKIISLVAIFSFFVLWRAFDFLIGFSFLLGALFSSLAGFIGMMISTKANLKVSQASQKGLKEGLDLAFKGGSVTGFLVASLSLLSVSGVYILFKELKPLIALGLGASLISIFARLGGGIYTKSADIGADLVGKIEKGIPEDDPRNPAVVADQVGDNIGDCAGMAADLFESYIVSIVAAMGLGILFFPNSPQAVSLPLILGAVAILASIISTFFVRLGKDQNIILAIYKGLIGAGILSALGFFPIIKEVAKNLNIRFLNLYLPTLIGLLITAAIFFFSELFTSKKYGAVKSIATSSQSGHAPNIITGLSIGMKATIFPIILISLGILISFKLSGMYGLAMTVVSMSSLTGLIIAADSFGPITDNAAGISEMAGLPEEVRKNSDLLDAAGNTTKEVTKAYTITLAGLASLVLFSVYTQELVNFGARVQFLLEDPRVLVGLLIGGMVSYYFSSLVLEAVGKTAIKVVEEVRRQFREIPGLIEEKAKPEYEKRVDIITKVALKEMFWPASLTILTPVLVGFLLGPEVLGGVLIGSIIVGIFIALSMTTSGAAWDNAKKYIEEGNFGGKGSLAHQAAVTGDTVGGPFKDTVGPAINPMIKVLNIIALLIVSLII